MKKISFMERMRRQKAIGNALHKGKSKAVHMREFNNSVAKLKAHKSTPRGSLELALENIDDCKMVVVLSLDKDNAVDFSWSQGPLRDLTFIEKCFTKAVLDELTVRDD